MSKKKITFTNVACGVLLLLGTTAASASTAVTGGTFAIDFTAGSQGFFVDQTVSGGTNDGLTYAQLDNGTAMAGAISGNNGNVTLHTGTAVATINGSTVVNPGTRALVATDFSYDETATTLAAFSTGAAGNIGTLGAIYMPTNTVAGDVSLDATSLNGVTNTWVAVNQIDFFGFGAYDLVNLVLDSNDASGFTITGDVLAHTNLAAFMGVSAGDQIGTFTLNGVSAVPVPAAVWLFSSAIAGLGLSARRKQTAL